MVDTDTLANPLSRTYSRHLWQSLRDLFTRFTHESDTENPKVLQALADEGVLTPQLASKFNCEVTVVDPDPDALESVQELSAEVDSLKKQLKTKIFILYFPIH